MIITKTYSIEYEIIKCVKWKRTIGEVVEMYYKMREDICDLSKCFVCEHKFITSEYPYLATIKGTKNKFICSECAKKIKRESEDEDDKRR